MTPSRSTATRFGRCTVAPQFPSSFTAAGAVRLIAEFLEHKPAHTRRAYQGDLDDYARHRRTKHATAAASVLELLQMGPREANRAIERYKGALAEQSRAEATIRRRLSTIRGIIRQARKKGIITWTIEVGNRITRSKEATRRVKQRTNIQGPPPGKIAEIRAILATRRTPQNLRDLVIVALLTDIVARVSEASLLNVEDLDLAKGLGFLIGKGRATKVEVHLPDPTVKALRAWLKVRPGSPTGPVLVPLNRGARDGQRLSTRGIFDVVRKLGRLVGIPDLHPHSFRHTGTTAALRMAAEQHIPIDRVMEFTRHRRIDTLIRYHDKLNSKQAVFANAVAAATRKR